VTDQPSALPNSRTISSRSKIAFAIVVLIVGVLGCLIFLHSSDQNRDYARTTHCASNLKELALAIAVYAQEHNGKIPKDFEEMSKYYSSDRLLICPAAKDQTHYSYEFTGATNIWDVSSNIAILREIEPNHYRRRFLLFDDGNVQLNSTVEP